MKEILKNLKTQHLVTGLAGVFALVSVQNIAHFFINLNHPIITSWTLGFAIGTALVFMAHLLSEVNMKDTKAFYSLLGVTIVLVFLTGLIQGVEYSKELNYIGYILAFVLSATGELVLPLAYSWHRESKQREDITNTGQKIEEITSTALLDVMSNIDLEQAKNNAEKQVKKLLDANVKHVVHKMMPKPSKQMNNDIVQMPKSNGQMDKTLSKPNDHLDNHNIQNSVHIGDLDENPVHLDNVQNQMDKPNDQNNVQMDSMNNAKMDKITTRRNQIVEMADGQEVATFVAECIETLNVSRQTIKRDLQFLEDSNILYCNGSVEKI